MILPYELSKDLARKELEALKNPPATLADIHRLEKLIMELESNLMSAIRTRY